MARVCGGAVRAPRAGVPAGRHRQHLTNSEGEATEPASGPTPERMRPESRSSNAGWRAGRGPCNGTHAIKHADYMQDPNGVGHA